MDMPGLANSSLNVSTRYDSAQRCQRLRLLFAIPGWRDRAKTAEVVGDSVLVACRHHEGIGAADLAGARVVQVAPQLELKCVHTAQEPLVKLLDHCRIAGEAA